MHSYKYCKQIKNSAIFGICVDLAPLWMSLDNKKSFTVVSFQSTTPQAFTPFLDDIIKHKINMLIRRSYFQKYLDR